MELNGGSLGGRPEAQDSVGLASTMKEEKKEGKQLPTNKSVELPLAINWFIFPSLDAKEDSLEMLSSLRRFSLLYTLLC